MRRSRYRYTGRSSSGSRVLVGVVIGFGILFACIAVGFPLSPFRSARPTTERTVPAVRVLGTLTPRPTVSLRSTPATMLPSAPSPPLAETLSATQSPVPLDRPVIPPIACIDGLT